MTPLELGRIAYAAYGRSTGGVNHLGRPMPTWDDLPEPIRVAWMAAAGAVRAACEPG